MFTPYIPPFDPYPPLKFEKLHLLIFPFCIVFSSKDSSFVNMAAGANEEVWIFYEKFIDTEFLLCILLNLDGFHVNFFSRQVIE